MDRLRAGYVRGRIDVGSLHGVYRQRSENFKAHPNRPCAGYNGGRSLQVRRLRPCVGVVTIFDLAHCVKREGENPRDYLAGWLHIQADLTDYPNDDAMYHEGM